MIEYSNYTADYLKYCHYHKRLSNKTNSAYRIDLAQYQSFSYELTKQSLWDYIEHLNKLYNPKTAKRKIATLKAFLHYLIVQDLINCNPFDKIEITIKEPLLLPKTIPLDIIEKLITYAYQQIISAKTNYQLRCTVRNTAIIELLFGTGARVAEICNLQEADVNFQGKSVKLYGKGSKERIIPIENESVLSILHRYRSLHESQIKALGFFFVNKLGKRMSEQSVRSMLNAYCQHCEIDVHITPYMFRH